MTDATTVTRDPGAAADAAARARARAGADETVAVVDGPADRASVLSGLGRALSFPEYYGRNLDALEELLRDLSWLPAGPVTLVWGDGPLAAADPDTHRAVLAILGDVAAARAGDARPLHVVLAGPA